MDEEIVPARFHQFHRRRHRAARADRHVVRADAGNGPGLADSMPSVAASSRFIAGNPMN